METLTTKAGTWTSVTCSGCHGHGVYPSYDGEGYMDIRFCNECDGAGAQWKSPKGRLALYPGGPFRGSA